MNDNMLLKIFICFFIITLIIKYILKFINKQGIKTVEFYPPNNMNPAHLGYFLDGKVDTHDLIGLIVYMEYKGYIKRSIIEDENQITILEKIKKPSQKEDDYINFLYDKMFASSDKINLNGKNSFDFSDITSYIYDRLTKAYNDKPVFNKKQKYLKGILLTILLIMFTAPIIECGIYTFLIEDFNLLSLLSVLIIIAGFIFINKSYLTIIYKHGSTFLKKQASFQMRILIILIIIVTIVFNEIFYFDFTHNTTFLDSLLIPIITLITLMTINSIQWRNNEYKQILAKAESYKNFILLTEKDKIDQLIADDPNYFYKTIPYAYIFGVSDKWIKNEHDDISCQLLDVAVCD